MKKLLFFTVEEQHKLCISKSIKQKIFKIAHDQIYHDEFHRTYDRLRYSVYIRHLIKRLWVYINHCFECQLNQTKRHSIYEQLNFIVISAISFHFIAMNFIVALSLFTQSYNVFLIITNKYTKKILLLFKKKTHESLSSEIIISSYVSLITTEKYQKQLSAIEISNSYSNSENQFFKN